MARHSTSALLIARAPSTRTPIDTGIHIRGNWPTYLPHGLPELVAYGTLVFFSGLLIVHWLRRTFGRSEITEVGPTATVEIRFFDRFQRLYHWGTTFAFLGVLFTGIALYDPATFEPIIQVLGLPFHGFFPLWVTVHVGFSLALAILLGAHIVWDVAKLRSMRKMLPDRQDFRDALTRTRNFLNLTSEYPRMGKYDAFMKSFHLYLPIAFIVLGLTGIYQYFFAPWWLFPFQLHDQIEPFWKPTAIHDFFGFLLVAVVVGHTYFALLRINRPLLQAILSGKLGPREVSRRYRKEAQEGGTS